jgi:hypothetical protein
MRFNELESSQPEIGDILEVEINDEIVETVIVGITNGVYIVETDSDTGMALLESRSDWDSNMPGYKGDYGGAENWGRRSREDDEHHEIDRQREQQLAQYNQTGKFWLKQKDTQEHISDAFVGKAAANTAALELLKQQPELRGNIVITAWGPSESRGVTESYPKHQDLSGVSTEKLKAYLAKQSKQSVPGEGTQVKRVQAELQRRQQGVAEGSQPNDIAVYHHTGPNADKKAQAHAIKLGSDYGHFRHDMADKNDNLHIVTQKRYFPAYAKQQGVAEGEEHLSRIRKLSGLEEATKLPASSREFGGDEFQDYMKRIVGTPDVDKAGNVKVDKKGNEKYVSGKTKTDRYKMPYIHRSSVIEYLGPDGTSYDEEAVKKTLAQRPKALLKQNEKMKHSNGEFEQFFNVGFAALTGIALDEQTNKLIIVNTCPGAGSCKVDCFAMKGGKVQFKNAWQSDGRILTYLLNDPDGFFNQLSNEISKEEQAGAKGDKKFPKGWKTTIRWHDAGDFFSPEYLDLALKMAAKHPDTKFYAYTKMAGAALAKKPANFIINWSEGAHTSQEKQVKASDANLDTTKNSRIVPDELFQDLLVKDEKKNLVKGSEGQWQVQPDKLPELKQRLAKQYGLSANSILDYNEYMAKRKSIPAGMKYNVIVAPGEGDISANDPNIISTLLLKH